jgi:hypothetical protein
MAKAIAKPSEVGRSLSAVGSECELSPEARALLTRHTTPESYIRALRGEGKHTDALHFLAHWLPKREAVWWGCLCVWHVYRKEIPDAGRAAVRAVVQWVQEPIEPRRRTVEKLVEPASGTRTAPGCLALAAMLSGGSLLPEGLPIVPPAAHLTAHAIANMLVFAAAEKQPTAVDLLHAQFLDLGLEVLEGKNRWDAREMSGAAKPH